jgi:hypothetical protein
MYIVDADRTCEHGQLLGVAGPDVICGRCEYEGYMSVIREEAK